MARRLAALLWDVDGTLAETELEGHRLAFNAAFAEHGLPWQWDRDTYLPLLRMGGGRERMAAFLEQAEGAPPAAALLDRLVEAKKRHYARLLQGGALPLREGVVPLIDAARVAGLRQAIVTTSSRAAVDALVAGSLAERAGAFCAWFCGDDVTRKKPDPEGYLLALARLGLDPATVLAVEDSPPGLAAATAAGLTTLVTLSSGSRHEPAAAFAAAAAVLDGLGSPERHPTLLRGPACPGGQVTLSWLERLLPPP